MHLIRGPLAAIDPSLPEVAVRVDRQKLARRLWRGTAEDGTDFGFEVAVPLRHGEAVWSSETARYVIRQTAEPLLEISIDVAPEEAAVIGWAVGNMHFVIEAQEKRILAPDDSGLRQALDRIGVGYRVTSGVFQPHRFANIVGHAHGPHASVDAHPYLRQMPSKG
jgi:urease accessory protein